MAPPKKPTKLRILEGNRSRRPLPKNEVQPSTSSSTARPPSYLKGVARTEWKRVATELLDKGLLTDVDRAVLEAYCTTYANYREALDKVNELGAIQVTQTGYQQLSGWMSVLSKCRQDLVRYASQFGMSPSSRAGLTVDVDTKNPLEMLIKSANSKRK